MCIGMTAKFLKSLENSVAILKQAGLFIMIEKNFFYVSKCIFINLPRKVVCLKDFPLDFWMFMSNKNEINV